MNGVSNEGGRKQAARGQPREAVAWRSGKREGFRTGVRSQRCCWVGGGGVVSELQFSPCKMRLKIVPASRTAMRVKFDNEYQSVPQLWCYVLWGYSK